MRNKIIFILAFAGVLIGLVSAYIFGIEKKPQPPVFKPASNPYTDGIYAEGIIESYQTSGANINMYPEIPGTISHIFVDEGNAVKKGAPLIQIDDSVQRATVEQQKAQVELASASFKSAEDQLNKQKKSYELEPRSVSKNDLDNAENAVNVARANVEVMRKQYELSQTLLSKYSIKAPADGVILSINTSVGSYISAQGTYNTYTQGFSPILVMGGSQTYIGVRCYIDEILIHRLPKTSHMSATMHIRGTDIDIPLEYVRVQPYVSPKIELSNQRAERVDVRVLPVIFRFERPKNISIYPGQLVDVYISAAELRTNNTSSR
ncbi:MAG TPA: biotin/lipoyl-binding protein [Dissulfurispiraceae bacterium]|nr:biotin/lipoyl-binding protein [Dissulfurispiraceae bacterium]